MKRRHTTPRYYARNAAMQAQRRFLRTGKTEAERLDDHREATANVLVLCILAAIYDKYGIGEMRLQRVVDCANEISAKYALEKQVRGEERAKATLVAAVWWFMPPFLLPAAVCPQDGEGGCAAGRPARGGGHGYENLCAGHAQGAGLWR